MRVIQKELFERQICQKNRKKKIVNPMDNRGLFDFKKKKKGDKKDRTKLGYTRVKRVMKLFPVIS